MTRGPWIVEVVLDTGQRLQSVDLPEPEAASAARDMRSRVSVVAVTMLELGTGQALTWPSHNLMAGQHRDSAAEQLSVALGG